MSFEFNTRYECLKSEYSGGTLDGGFSHIAFSFGRINNFGFMGAREFLLMTTPEPITHESPACIASPVVKMYTLGTITLGLTQQSLMSIPVRVFAPEELTFIARHICIGNIEFLIEPRTVSIACQKLSFIKTTEEEPPCFEIVKSWTMSEKTEIEIIKV